MLNAISQELSSNGVKPSYQRVKIFEYMRSHHSHPTAEEIFGALQPFIPTLARTTVYNTLNVLEENGLIRSITIEDKEVRYDVVLADHGHFKCEICGKIYDFAIELMTIEIHEMQDFHIKDKNVYFKGICKMCL
jgi:Fur family peroxide stress response transcriptional regulator